ncbi:NTP transferase domain-containing protein [Lysobacter sp. CFH 32150]|uniref:molybdenum cofactor guanylyltransferase n=1 Tax=Lysobacter sp. CFH 32150 TaxID=2927128 RepID=UPI001FA81576|nr:molybdenum cofactor guanylyltransferase [Lysobacter sp. CFH 32150]
MIASRDITLGILAGGRASRLGGLDKAWLERDGVPQVLRIARRFAPEVGKVLVSANREPERYAGHGLDAVVDRIPDAGPLSGLDALAQACTSPWLLTLPVDLIGVNECLLPSLVAAGEQGSYAEDDDGLQPLVALWRVVLLREAATQALETRDMAIQALQARVGMVRVRFAGVRFGNLNTFADLQAAGFQT